MPGPLPALGRATKAGMRPPSWVGTTSVESDTVIAYSLGISSGIVSRRWGGRESRQGTSRGACSVPASAFHPLGRDASQLPHVGVRMVRRVRQEAPDARKALTNLGAGAE